MLYETIYYERHPSHELHHKNGAIIAVVVVVVGPIFIIANSLPYQ